MAPTHFWDPATTASLLIGEIADRDPNRPVDTTRRAWAQIPDLYFPSQTATANGPRYLIEPRPSDHRCSVAVVQLLISVRSQDEDQLVSEHPLVTESPLVSSRDVVWIECRRPDQETSSEWKDVLSQIVEKHPRRRIYLILTFGLKWLTFLWDPTAPVRESPLQMLKDDRRETWTIDPHVHIIAPSDLPGQRHFSQIQNGALVIDTQKSYSLDFWTLDQSGNPANLQDLLFLERVFAIILAEDDYNPNQI